MFSPTVTLVRVKVPLLKMPLPGTDDVFPLIVVLEIVAVGAIAMVLLLRMPGSGATEKVRVVEEIVSRFGNQLPQSFSVYRNGRLRVRRKPEKEG